jgi:multidrug efflux system outer membrane protein
VLEGSARLRVVALAALLGRGAETLPPMVPRPLPVVQAALPESVRLDLIARRPDVAASRWRIESAQQGLVAIRGEYYPDVSLRALVGLSSIEIGSLLKPGSATPSFGAAIHLPLFDSGLRDARFGARQAQVESAVAAYDEAVFAAAREVATAASTVLAVQAQHEQREVQRAEALALVESAGARVRAGTADVRAQLSASLLLNLDQDGLAQLNLAALSADVALQRALGGGYVARETTP